MPVWNKRLQTIAENRECFPSIVEEIVLSTLSLDFLPFFVFVDQQMGRRALSRSSMSISKGGPVVIDDMVTI